MRMTHALPAPIEATVYVAATQASEPRLLKAAFLPRGAVMRFDFVLPPPPPNAYGAVVMLRMLTLGMQLPGNGCMVALGSVCARGNVHCTRMAAAQGVRAADMGVMQLVLDRPFTMRLEPFEQVHIVLVLELQLQLGMPGVCMQACGGNPLQPTATAVLALTPLSLGTSIFLDRMQAAVESALLARTRPAPPALHQIEAPNRSTKSGHPSAQQQRPLVSTSASHAALRGAELSTILAHRETMLKQRQQELRRAELLKGGFFARLCAGVRAALACRGAGPSSCSEMGG